MLARSIVILLLLAISNGTGSLGAADEQSKVKLALDSFFAAAGKQDWDKRETERRREADKEARSAIAHSKGKLAR
jgi:uncharacterized protein YdaU (DUF1376 family)